jgi:hypothetical protein
VSASVLLRGKNCILAVALLKLHAIQLIELKKNTSRIDRIHFQADNKENGSC